MVNAELQQKRNDIIYKEYAALWATGIREDIIFEKLSTQFFLEESTIYRIILKYTKTEKVNKK